MYLYRYIKYENKTERFSVADADNVDFVSMNMNMLVDLRSLEVTQFVLLFMPILLANMQSSCFWIENTVQIMDAFKSRQNRNIKRLEYARYLMNIYRNMNEACKWFRLSSQMCVDENKSVTMQKRLLKSDILKAMP